MAENSIKITAEMQQAINEFKTARKEINDLKAAVKGFALTGQEESAASKDATQKLQQKNAAMKQSDAITKQLTQTNKINAYSLLELGENLTIVTAGLHAMFMAMKDVISEGLKSEQLRANFRGTAEEFERIREASGKMVEDTKLLELTNQATGLNNSIEQQAKLWQASRLIARSTGQDITDVFSGLIRGEEGMTRGLITAGLSRTKYNEIIKQSVKELKGEIEETTNSNGQKEINIKGLDAETQAHIRQNAILKLVQDSYGDLNNIQATNYEKTKMLEAATKDFSERMGSFIGNQLIGFIEGLGIASTKSVETAGAIKAIGTQLAAITPLVAGLKIAFPALFTTLMATIAPVVGGLAAITAQIGLMYTNVKYFIDNIGKVGIWELLTHGAFNKSANMMSNEELGLTGSSDLIKRALETNKSKFETFQKEKELQESFKTQLGDINKKHTETGKHLKDNLETTKELNAQLAKTVELTFDLNRASISGFKFFEPQTLPETDITRMTFKPRPLSEIEKEKQDALKEEQQAELDMASNMISTFDYISGLVGEMPKEFQLIMGIIQQIIQGLGGGGNFGWIFSLLGLIPGGGIITGLAGLGGSGGRGQAGGISGNNVNAPMPFGGGGDNFVVQGDVTDVGKFKLFKNGREIYLNRGNSL